MDSVSSFFGLVVVCLVVAVVVVSASFLAILVVGIRTALSPLVAHARVDRTVVIVGDAFGFFVAFVVAIATLVVGTTLVPSAIAVVVVV